MANRKRTLKCSYCDAPATEFWVLAWEMFPLEGRDACGKHGFSLSDPFPSTKKIRFKTSEIRDAYLVEQAL